MTAPVSDHTNWKAQTELPAIRMRKKKTMPGEQASDEPISVAIDKFRIEVYNSVLDKVINSFETRFVSHGVLYAELTALNPKNFKKIKSVNDIPQFEKMVNILKKIYPEITTDKIRDELFDFSTKWDALRTAVPNEYYTVSDEACEESDEITENTMGDEIDDDLELEPVPIVCKSCKGCASCCFQVLLKYNLFSNAYSNLFQAYKFLLTLSTTQVACERSFSVLKYIKESTQVQ